MNMNEKSKNITNQDIGITNKDNKAHQANLGRNMDSQGNNEHVNMNNQQGDQPAQTRLDSKEDERGKNTQAR